MSSPVTPETAAKLAIIRQKMMEGTATIEELRESVRLMKADRNSAAQTSASSKGRTAKAKAVVKSADEMLDELGKI